MCLRSDMPSLWKPLSNANCGCLERRAESKGSAELCLARMFSVGGGNQDSCGSSLGPV